MEKKQGRISRRNFLYAAAALAGTIAVEETFYGKLYNLLTVEPTATTSLPEAQAPQFTDEQIKYGLDKYTSYGYVPKPVGEVNYRNPFAVVEAYVDAIYAEDLDAFSALLEPGFRDKIERGLEYVDFSTPYAYGSEEKYKEVLDAGKGGIEAFVNARHEKMFAGEERGIGLEAGIAHHPDPMERFSIHGSAAGFSLIIKEIEGKYLITSG